MAVKTRRRYDSVAIGSLEQDEAKGKAAKRAGFESMAWKKPMGEFSVSMVAAAAMALTVVRPSIA